ncbi:hypothetical protein BGX24_011511 [Mortierella sp. AD032]|nr:hypothetical protein BGX24_011511 [Mortierella sp. AD032]
MTSDSTSRKDRFKKEDLDRVLSWLEHQPNFELIHGTSGQKSVGRHIWTAASGYAELAALVSRHNKGGLNLTGKAMRERFQRHIAKYKSVKELSSHTGFGVTDKDRKNGIYTLASKLERLCTCYQRMDALYGSKPNVNPLRSRGLSCEDGEDPDIDGLDDIFGDNDNDNDNSSDNGSDNDNYSDGDNDNDNDQHNDDNNDNDYAERSRLDEPDVIEVPPASNPASKQQVGRSWPLKRRASDTNSIFSRRSRATDTHKKAPPKLDHAPSQTGLDEFATTYMMESSVSKLKVLREIEEKKLGYDKETHTSQIELDRKRVELEQQKITLEREQTERRLEAEKEQAERNMEAERELLTLRLKSEVELEERKLLWEKERMEADRDTKYMMQRAMVVQSAMNNGFKLEDIKEILAMVKGK